MKKKEAKKLNKIDAQAVHKKRALITENFQNEVNKFFDESKIHLKDLLDIKYQHHNDKYTAMIIYQKYEDNIY